MATSQRNSIQQLHTFKYRGESNTHVMCWIKWKDSVMIKALWFRCRITSHQIRISYFFNFWNSLPSCRSFFRLMVRLQFVSTFHSFKWDYRYDRSTLVRVFQLLRIIFKIDPENWSTLDLMMAFNRVYAIFFSFLSLLEF